MRTLLFIAAAATLIAMGCQPPTPADITPASLLNSLRILAIKAEPPDVAPGQTTTLSALVINPDFNDTEIHYLWVMCDPDLTSPLGSKCASFDLARDPSTFFGNIFSPVAGVHINPFARETATYTAPADVFDSLPAEAPQRKTGVPADILLIVYVGGFDALSDPTAPKVLALKTIRIAEPGPDTNTNPHIDEFRLNGDPVIEQLAGDVSPGAQVELSAVPSADSQQTFIRVLPDGTQKSEEEQLVFSWFTTGGRFDAALDVAARTKGSAPIKFKVPSPFPDGAIEVYAVLRDARGGMDWTRRVLRTP